MPTLEPQDGPSVLEELERWEAVLADDKKASHRLRELAKEAGDPGFLLTTTKIAGATTMSRPAPFSLRLTEDERQRLEAQAGGMPLASYIKSVVFSEDAPKHRARRRPPVAEQQLLRSYWRRLDKCGMRIISTRSRSTLIKHVGG